MEIDWRLTSKGESVTEQKVEAYCIIMVVIAISQLLNSNLQKYLNYASRNHIQ
jgi:hypothetical protein